MNFAACGSVLWLGCNETMVLNAKDAWRDVAINLQCMHLDKLSKSDLELWLQCGGDLRLQPFGTPLLSHLNDEEAKDFLKERAASRMWEKIAGDWRTWAALGAALVASFAALGLEHFAKYSRLRRPQAERRERTERTERTPFELGAHTLVCRAFGRPNVVLRRIWRLCDISAFMILVGFRPIVMYWASWLPLVAILYIVPGIAAFGPKAVLSNPLLILTTGNLASCVFGLLRVVLLQILFVLVRDSQLSLWFDVDGYQEMQPVDASYWLSWLVDPDFHTWLVQKPWGIWPESDLQDTFTWAPSATADEIFQTVRNATEYFSLVYASCLLLAILRSFGRRSSASRCCGDLGESVDQFHEIRLAVRDILQKEAEEFSQVSKKIKPVVACGFPCQDAGIYPRVGLMLLDITLDINTIIGFLSERRFEFAGIMAFVVTRSLLKQMYILRPWHLRQALHSEPVIGSHVQSPPPPPPPRNADTCYADGPVTTDDHVVVHEVRNSESHGPAHVPVSCEMLIIFTLRDLPRPELL